MKRILLSLATVTFLVGAGAYATRAFFSDTETSTGNTFVAGSIDLQVDNTSYYNGLTGILEAYPAATWQKTDLTNQLFFNFVDIKPGDLGEDTVSLAVSNNPSWVCADLAITVNDDVTCTDSEMADDQDCTAPGMGTGDLASQLNFIFWADDGDNVLETDEQVLTQGPASNVLSGVTWALVDSTTNVWGEGVGKPMAPNTDYYLGKAWCFGVLTESRVQQALDNSPTIKPGVSCEGGEVNNAAQTDMLMGDISFYVEQARHNPNFVCGSHYTPVVMGRQNLENKDDSWQVIADDTWGNIAYSDGAQSFYGMVVGQGIAPGGYYQITLNGPGVCSSTDVLLASAGGNLFQSGYWNNWAPGLAPDCTGAPGQGIYNMALISDWYTFVADGSGNFAYAFNLALPKGSYSGVKVLVKKMLDSHVAPWVDGSTEHTTNLFETAPISFAVN